MQKFENFRRLFYFGRIQQVRKAADSSRGHTYLESKNKAAIECIPYNRLREAQWLDINLTPESPRNAFAVQGGLETYP